MARVKYCENSTITEAWTTIMGLPAPLDETDAPLMTRTAKETIEGLEVKPAVVAVLARKDLAAPFWSQQLGWDGERYLARYGHRFLSVHFIRQGEERYQTFAKTVQPSIEIWLDIYRQAFSRSAEKHLVNIVGFGYVNTFDFEPKGFDLSRYFKLNFGVDVGAGEAGLLGLNTGFRFYDSRQDMYLSVNLGVESPTPEHPMAQVVTKVSAERRGLENVSFANKNCLVELVVAAKEAANETFFGFATQETHDIMGVVTDADA
jgi:hypothetical protein